MSKYQYDNNPKSTFNGAIGVAGYSKDPRCYDSRLRKLLCARLQITSVWQYDVAALQAEQLRWEPGFITDMDFSPDGRYLIASCTNKETYLFNAHNSRLLKRSERCHNDAVLRVRFVRDFHFVSGAVDGSLALWDIRKQTAEVCRLDGHTRPIRSIDYNPNLEWIISSAQDGQIRYWSLPAFQSYAAENLIVPASSNEDSPYKGVLLTCPNFNQACMGLGTLALCKDVSGTIYVIDNLDLSHLKEDFRNKRLDDSFKFQMSRFTPNASPSKRNRIRVLEAEDYLPIAGAGVSSVSHLVSHPSMPILLVRVTTTQRISFRQELKDWLCVCTLQESYRKRLQQPQTSNMSFLMAGFGSNVVEETLLFYAQEERFSSFREKHVSFSACGRLIASPNKFGVRIMAFSREMHSVDEVKLTISSDEGWPFHSIDPTELFPYCKIERPVGSVICCKFSPKDLILAVGDSNNQITFCQPRI